MKDKNPPSRKNGANGMYFCLCLYAQSAPEMHAIISEIDNPIVPSHNPPTPINFMSPMPIGGVVFGFFFCSLWLNIMPIIVVVIYPNVAAKIASGNDTGNGKKQISNKPVNISGNRYLSGIIL